MTTIQRAMLATVGRNRVGAAAGNTFSDDLDETPSVTLNGRTGTPAFGGDTALTWTAINNVPDSVHADAGFFVMQSSRDSGTYYTQDLGITNLVMECRRTTNVQDRAGPIFGHDGVTKFNCFFMYNGGTGGSGSRIGYADGSSTPNDSGIECQGVSGGLWRIEVNLTTLFAKLWTDYENAPQESGANFSSGTLPTLTLPLGTHGGYYVQSAATIGAANWGPVRYGEIGDF